VWVSKGRPGINAPKSAALRTPFCRSAGAAAKIENVSEFKAMRYIWWDLKSPDGNVVSARLPPLAPDSGTLESPTGSYGNHAALKG
jgi:hypothetical protein